jgi:uncharacterized phage-associated protein
MKAPRNGYPSLSVANHLIGLASAENKKISYPQLQSMLYLSHGWHLALTGRPLVNEPFYAWRKCWYRGPLLGGIYVEFNRYGAIGGIPGLVPGYSLYQAGDDSYAKRIMSRVWKLYGSRPEFALIALTRADDTPWQRAILATDPRIERVRLPNSEIKSYFEPRLSMRSERDMPRAVARRSSWLEQLWSWAVG